MAVYLAICEQKRTWNKKLCGQFQKNFGQGVFTFAFKRTNFCDLAQIFRNFCQRYKSRTL